MNDKTDEISRKGLNHQSIQRVLTADTVSNLCKANNLLHHMLYWCATLYNMYLLILLIFFAKRQAIISVKVMPVVAVALREDRV